MRRARSEVTRHRVREHDDIVAIRLVLNSPGMQPKDTLSTEALNFEGRLNSLAEQLEAIGMDFTLISVRKLLGEPRRDAPTDAVGTHSCIGRTSDSIASAEPASPLAG